MGINARQLKAAVKAMQQMSDTATIRKDPQTNEAVTDFNSVVESKDIVMNSLPHNDALANLFDSLLDNTGDDV